MLLSVVIPIYNEQTIIKNTIYNISNYFLKLNKIEFEIIVINDGSNDNSKEILTKLEFTNLIVLDNHTNLGKGAALKKGVEVARGDVVLFTDADLSTPIKHFDDLYKKYLEGFDIVIGSRSKKDSNILIKQNLIRIIAGRLFNYTVRCILNIKYSDTQCGFKLFDTKIIKKVVKHSIINKFAIDAEILFLAKKLNYKVYEKGVFWLNNKNTSVKLISDSINMFCDLLKIRFNKYHS